MEKTHIKLLEAPNGERIRWQICKGTNFIKYWSSSTNKLELVSHDTLRNVLLFKERKIHILVPNDPYGRLEVYTVTIGDVHKQGYISVGKLIEGLNAFYNVTPLTEQELLMYTRSYREKIGKMAMAAVNEKKSITRAKLFGEYMWVEHLVQVRNEDTDKLDAKTYKLVLEKH
jgi:hypothetical protein